MLMTDLVKEIGKDCSKKIINPFIKEIILFKNKNQEIVGGQAQIAFSVDRK